ncbi:MAG: TolC family protein [Bryobacteraceae bacterium]
MASVCGATLFAAMAAGQEFSIADLVARAAERNRQFLALRQRVTESWALLRQAGVRPAPTVEVNGVTGRPLGTQGEEQFSAGYFRPVETYGKREKRIQVAKKAVHLAEAGLREQLAQLSYEVKVNYADAVAERQRLEALDRLASLNRESYRLVDARVREDQAAPLDRQLLLVELNQVEAQRALGSGRAETALARLRSIAGIEPGEDLRVIALEPVSRIPYSLPQLRERALQMRTELRIASLLEEQGAAEEVLAEAEGRPDLTLFARYSRVYSRFDDQFGFSRSGSLLPLQDRDDVVAFGLAFPLKSRRSNQGNIEAAAARTAQARLRREHLERTVALEVDAAWRRWDAATRALEILDSGVLEQSRKNLNVIREAYDLGHLNLLDVLSQQRRLTEIQMAYIEARADVARAFADLERAAGGDLR